MRAENLTEVIRAAPFQPFTLRLADGTLIDIRHPEWIAHRTETRTAVVIEANGSVRIIDVGLLLEIQLAPPVPAGTVVPEPNGGD